MRFSPKPIGRLTSPASPSHLRTRAFSLVQTMITLTIGAIITGMTVNHFAGSRAAVAAHKLESDVRSLNTAIRIYRSFGGNLDSVSTPEEVLGKLQSQADSVSARQTAGLTGSLIDRRLRAHPLGDTDSLKPRAVWDASNEKFVLTNSGSNGVASFIIDNSLAGEPVQEETREQHLNLANEGPWIWDYNDSSAVAANSPTPIFPSGADESGPSGGGGTGGTPGGTGPSSTAPLSPPQFSIPGGVHIVTAFDLELTLHNPNTPGTSRIIYRDGESGGWVPYFGGVLDVVPGTKIYAMAESILPEEWSNSPTVDQTYDAGQIVMDPPVILTSSLSFDYVGNQIVNVEMSHTNEPEYSSLEYRINESPWQSYGGGFSLFYIDYPNGAHIEARVIGTAEDYPEYYVDSEIASAWIEEARQYLLEAPFIWFSHKSFCEDVDSITVKLTNPNSDGSSDIHYRLEPLPGMPGEITSYGMYSGEFDVAFDNYPGGFGVRAYAKASNIGYLDSEEAVLYTRGNGLGLQGGHFDLDTSSFIADIDGGSTDGHVHEYDDKHDVTGGNFFQMLESKLHSIQQDMPNATTKFKIIVANTNLSPGGRMVINKNYNTSDYSSFESVGGYGGTGVADLPIYSLNGQGGTVKLEDFGLYFGEYSIPEGGLIPTNTGDVRNNTPGKNGEWRNGALTVQAVKVNADGSDGFTLDPSLSAGGHGVATSGLIWEATFFWHWGGKSYHEEENTFVAGDADSVAEHVESFEAGSECGDTNEGHGIDPDSDGYVGGDSSGGDSGGSSGGGDPDPNPNPGTICPPDGLIAEYEWNNGAFEFTGGAYPNAITFSNLQFKDGDPDKVLIADFNSTLLIDLVDVESDNWVTDNYVSSTLVGVVSGTNDKEIKTLKFYCAESGSSIDPVSGSGGSEPGDGGSGNSNSGYVCPLNGLIAEYEWQDGIFKFKNGAYPNGITFTNLQFKDGDPDKVLSADFYSVLPVDSVELESDGWAYDNYIPAMKSGDIVGANGKEIKTVRFYCSGWVEPKVVLLDEDALSSSLSTLASLASGYGVSAAEMMNEDDPVGPGDGNPFLLWSEDYYGDELLITGGNFQDLGWFVFTENSLVDEEEFYLGTESASNLNAVSGVVGLDHTNLFDLVGETIIGFVYDGDIAPDAENNHTADLSGDRLGRFAFTVTGYEAPGSIVDSQDPLDLWDLRIRVENPYGTTFEDPAFYSMLWE